MHMTVDLDASVDMSVSVAVAASLVVTVGPDVFADLDASVDVDVDLARPMRRDPASFSRFRPETPSDLSVSFIRLSCHARLCLWSWSI
jgi:hypothetical protein